MLGSVLLLSLTALLALVVPEWHYSRRWGYGPSGSIGVLLTIVLLLVIIGRI